MVNTVMKLECVGFRTYNLQKCVYLHEFYLPIIPTQQIYTILAQFDWLRANLKWHLNFDKSIEEESWNIFALKNFKN